MHASEIKNRMHTWIKNRGHSILTKSYRFIKEEIQLSSYKYYILSIQPDM